MVINIGDTLVTCFGDNNRNNKTEEVRGIIDDVCIVTKVFKEGDYDYAINDISWYELLYKEGHLTIT